MKKITLDFENETVELHFGGQNGVERFPGLKNLEAPILSLLGYQSVDMHATSGRRSECLCEWADQ